MKRNHLPFAAIAWAATTLAHQPKAVALGNLDSVDEEAASTLTWREIRVRHIAPRTMAKWLNPDDQVEPQLLIVAPKALASSDANLPTTPQREPRAYKLPEGVQTVIPVDSRNTLLVLATKAGARALETVVALLDRPLLRVEIETQLVRIRSQDAKSLNINFDAPGKIAALDANKNRFPLAVGHVRGDLQAELQKLAAQQKARVAWGPRISTSNGLSSSININMGGAWTLLGGGGARAFIGVKDGAGNFTPISKNAQADDPRFAVSSDLILTVTPTINWNHTVTLVMNLDIQTMLHRNEQTASTQAATVSDMPDKSFLLKNLPSAIVLASADDDETIALSGLSLESLQDFGLQWKGAPQTQNVIVLVTARFLNQPLTTNEQ